MARAQKRIQEAGGFEVWLMVIQGMPILAEIESEMKNKRTMSERDAEE